MFSFFQRPFPQRRPAVGDTHRRITLRAEALEDRTLLSAYSVVNLNDSGPGSLRDAVQQANAADGADVIDFAPGLSGTIALSSGELNVTDALTIEGPGAQTLAISGEDSSRAFRVDDGDAGTRIEVAIRGLTIRNGRADIAGGVGGGIYNAENLTLQEMVLRDNRAVGDPTDPVLVPTPAGLAPAAGGGAVFNALAASLSVGASKFRDNLALSPVGTQSQGGAIFNRGTAEVMLSHFKDNLANSASGLTAGPAAGGAIANRDGASLAVSHSSFRGNQVVGGDTIVPTLGSSSANGGAIANVFGSTAMVNSSHFSENQVINGTGGFTPSAGGALVNAFGSVMFVETSALDHNRAFGGPGGNLGGYAVGGGIANFLGGTLTVAGSLLSQNEAFGSAGANGVDGAIAGGGAIQNEQFSSVTITQTQFIDNRAVGGAGGLGANGGIGEGGGLSSAGDAFASISDSSFVGNRAIGGIAGVGGVGGIGQGGAILNEVATELGFTFAVMTIDNTFIAGNRAVGGTGPTGGNAFGGGIYNNQPAALALSGSLVLGNQAIGGSGGQGGSAYGGGLFVGRGGDVTVEDALVALNRARGGYGDIQAHRDLGSGGGLYVEDDATNVELIDSVFAINFDDSGISNILYGPLVGDN